MVSITKKSKIRKMGGKGEYITIPKLISELISCTDDDYLEWDIVSDEDGNNIVYLKLVQQESNKSKISKSGYNSLQTSIPKFVSKNMGCAEGDYIKWKVTTDNDGKVKVTASIIKEDDNQSNK